MFFDEAPSQTVDLRKDLRAATLFIHDRIEQIWSPNGAFNSKSTYLAFLRVLLDTHQSIGRTAAVLRRQMTEIAEEDARIRALRLDLGNETPRPFPASKLDEAYAWGVGYVLNGSALGASELLKNGHLGDDWPRRYLRLGQDYVKSGRLRQFFDELNSKGHESQQVMRGAIETFARLDPDREDIHWIAV